MKSRLPGPRRLPWLLALLLAVSLPALAHERGDRGRQHGHEPTGHGPVAVPAGVTVPSWDELSPEQRKYLGRHEAEWDTLPASRRVHALERAERRARWEAMPPEQRERIRQGMRNYRDMTPAQREKAREAMRVMRSLPEDQRERLKKQWRAMSPEQRRAWLETGGPGISPPPDGGGD
ncbi:hypothetical protein GCM10011521_04560 [Arenimonas soli]|uniref:DUF3106 domain-containing protein n=1 Tax=Arenimonas soli TaxID=2269504 RepID=A0ABQ1HCL2_9GAMM|nr:DUF3106 domain-containing protein [Arenimonas soli]GGA69457.1 hypothetical protein GCM10011521_04560 [Arenimonas soli]